MPQLTASLMPQTLYFPLCPTATWCLVLSTFVVVLPNNALILFKNTVHMQNSTSCNDTMNHQLKMLRYPSTSPQAQFDETPCSC